jgi:hypothetical protein
VLRSSHKVVTLRLGANGYAASPGHLRGGAWHDWPDDSSSADHANGIDTPLTERLAALKLSEVQHCTTLDVVLDIALMRLQVVRFPAGVRRPDERSAFLKAAFRNVFGRDAGNWHIIAEPAYVSEAVPAVAIDETLMQAITAFAARHKLKLRSLRPSFVDCFNSLRHKLAAHTGAFALIEGGRVCVGLWRHRAWLALSTQAFTAGDGESLAALCSQMLARVQPAMPDGSLYIAGADAPFAVPLDEGWTLQWLEPEVPSGTSTSATADRRPKAA